MKTLLKVAGLGILLALVIWAIGSVLGISLGVPAIALCATVLTIGAYFAFPSLRASPQTSNRGNRKGTDLPYPGAVKSEPLVIDADGKMRELASVVNEYAEENPMPGPTPLARRNPIALTRASRLDPAAAAASKSWFGGQPALGGQAWPVSSDGIPLHFMAQIDLAELQREAPCDILPSTGALLFFMLIGKPAEGQVIFVPSPDYQALATPPSEAIAPFSDVNWHRYFHGQPVTQKPLGFPKWPIKYTPLQRDSEFVYQPEHVSIDTAVGPKADSYFLDDFFDTHMSQDGHPILFWSAGHMLANELVHAMGRQEERRKAVELSINHVEKMLSEPGRENDQIENLTQHLNDAKARLETLTENAAQFENFVNEAYEFARAHPPSEQVSPKGLVWFETVLKAIGGSKANPDEKGVFADFIDNQWFAYISLKHLRRDWMRQVCNGSQDGFHALPENLRTMIAETYHRPEEGVHQIFGLARNVQSAATEHEDKHLLLQLNYDWMMHWEFGDLGAIQFWITDENIRGRHWHRAFATMESR